MKRRKNQKTGSDYCVGAGLIFGMDRSRPDFQFLSSISGLVGGPHRHDGNHRLRVFPENRRNYESTSGYPTMKINPAAFLTWITGFLAGFYIQKFYFPDHGMNVTAVVYFTWMRGALNRNTTPEIQFKSWFEKSVIPILYHFRHI